MAEVVSLGSINVDRTRYLSAAEIAALAAENEWLPEAGETKSIPAPPTDLTTGPYEDVLGGKAANQAVAAARAGTETTLLGKVGPDASQYDLRETLSRRGVDVSAVEPTRAPTGKAYVFVDETGENHIAIVAGANGAVDAAYIRDKLGVIQEASVLVFQNEIPAAGIMALLDDLAGRGDRPTVIFDPAPVDGADAFVDHAAVDIISPNASEYAALEPPLEQTDQTVIRRRGDADVIVSEGGAESFRVTPPTVDPVDTTGAGDVFNGYLAAELARGSDLETAVEWATAAASHSTELAGTQTAIPERETVRTYRTA
ncbi:MAG: PfkB family carbohydrate kinase [Halobacteriaceae archaeon]